MSRWFRFYDDAINDPKVLRMPEALRWHWVAMLCVASKNDGVVPCIEDVALSLRVTERKAGEIVEDLAARNLLDEIEVGVYAPHNWNGRQYKSDVSTPRVKRFRERQGNVSETPPETEADTEQSRKKEKKEARATRGAPLPEDWSPSDDDHAYIEKLGLTKLQALDGLEEMRLWAGANQNRAVGRKADWSKAYRSWMRRNLQRRNGHVVQEPSRGNSVIAASERLIQRIAEFDKAPDQPELRGGAGENTVRLLPQGRRERS